MCIQDEPILNLEQAKRYFIAMGCSHFHLDRENFLRRDEYYALNISSETESKWRQQEVERYFAEFPINKPEEIAFFYDRLSDLIECNSNNLERMLTLANDFSDILPTEKVHLVLSAIIGNSNALTHGGLIEKAYNIGLPNLAQKFTECAKAYIEKAENNDVSILWMRGYLIDVIMALGLKEKDSYLEILRQKDDIECFKYYQQGANEGNVFSMRMLAKQYEEGKGCKIDIPKANYWLTCAANSGNNLAKKELSELQRHRFFRLPFWKPKR